MNNIRSFKQYTPELGCKVFIDRSAVVTGQVILGDDASIWPCVSIRGDLLAIKIGDRTNVQDGAVLHTTHISKYNPSGAALTIGTDVTVGHNATLHGCTIEDKVLVGMNAVVLDGVVIKSETMIAAGSLVPPNKVLDGGLWVGNPARRVRSLTEQEKEFLLYSASHYVDLKNQHSEPNG